MRNRSQTKTINGSTSSILERWVNANGDQIYRSDTQHDMTTIVMKESESVISDVVALRPQVKVDPLTGSWKRIKYREVPYSRASSGVGLLFTGLRPVKPCTHVKTKVKLMRNLVVAESAIRFPGDPTYRRIETRTGQHCDGASVLLNNTSFTPHPDNVLWGSSAGSYYVEDYRKHDWFALTDSFNEACDQFLPSSFLAGESIAESGIFIDAFKAVLNPTRAIKILIDLALLAPKKIRRMNLGQASRYLAKNSADASLFYQFGIKPAINDIRSALDSHRKVESRMRFLASAAGRYVPVRVRTVLQSGIENVPLDAPEEGVPTHYQWQCDSRETTACIGAWARVREDLNFGDTWSAYLQYFGINKMAGLAWELIPFSFIVDWFTNCQERLNSLTRLQTGGPFTEITRLSASERKVTKELLYCIPGWSQSRTRQMSFPSDPFVIAERTITDYSRYTSIPDVSGVVDLSTLGLFHYLTGATLIVQRLLK